MPEPNNTPDKSGMEDQNEVTISKADLEALKANDARLKKLDSIAAEAELQTAEEYLEVLEDETVTLRRQVQSTAKPIEPDNSDPEKPEKPEKSDKPVVDESFTKEISRLDRASSQAAIESHMANYRVIEISKPEEQRHSYTRDQLEKVLQNEGPVVASLMQKKPGLERNMFAAAAYLLDVQSGVMPGKTTDDKLNGTANLNPGSRAAKPPANDKAEDQVKQAQAEIRDRIAPSVGGYTGD